MSTRTRNRRFLLFSAALLGALTGYGRGAYAVCINVGGANFECSGINLLQQDIGADNADVTTLGGFSVDTPNARGINITGNSDLSFTDVNAATITAATTGLHIASGVLGGSVTVNVNGVVTGDDQQGIYATNTAAGTDVSVTTGVGSNVTGYYHGIYAQNYGSGATTVTVNGDVTGENGTPSVFTNGSGIYAVNYGTDLTVTTSAGSTVTGYEVGITAENEGTGATRITANGDVVSMNTGISSNVANTGTSLTILANGDVTGTNSNGILADSLGSDALSVTANGDVTAGNIGIIVFQRTGQEAIITTGADSTVTGGQRGIYARLLGAGSVLSITVNGDVTGTTDEGIRAHVSTGDGADIIINTGAGSTVTGGDEGIYALNNGTGLTRITTHGDVTAGGDDGIAVDHDGLGPVDVTIGSESTITSLGGDADDFAIDLFGDSLAAAATVTVAGRLNGGAGGAIRFNQVNDWANRLELQPTAIINGTVFAGNGATDTLAFGGSGNGTFDLADIDTGAGTQQYQNFEMFQVDSGTWSFSGATTQAFTVSGGTLGGTGTFGDLTVNNGGTLAPGNSIGTLNVIGALTLGAGAIYEVEVNAAGQSDKVIVQGTVNLTGATLSVLAENGNYNTRTDYTIIDNDGNDAVVGTFATITSSLAFLTPSVLYDAGTGNDVVLMLLRNDTQFSEVATTRNQRDVADALDRFPTGNELFLAVVNQTAAGARQAFDALSGEIHATVAGVLADDNRYVREAILGRLMQAGHSDSSLGAAGPQIASIDSHAMALGYDNVAAPSSALAFWTRAYGAWGDYDGNNNAASADRDLGGFMSGMDADIGGSWRAGLTTGASYSSVSVNSRNSSADADSFYLGAYAGGMAGAFSLRGGGTWAWSDIDTSRAVVFPGFFERQKASYDADIGQIFGEVAYPTTMSGMSVEPFANLAYVSVDTDSFVERGGALASLRGRDTDQNVGYSTLGFRAATTTTWGSTEVTPHLSAAWQHAFNDVTPDAALAFATTGIGFNVTGVPLAKNSALIDAGLDFALAANLTAGVSYSGQFGDGVTDNAVKGQFTWLF